MSYRRLLDRRVTIVPTTVTPGAGPRGGDLVEEGTPIEDVPASRRQIDASELLDQRDAQSRAFRYSLPVELDDGTPLALTGYDRIVDGDETFEIRGAPEVFSRRRRRLGHHLEADAYLID